MSFVWIWNKDFGNAKRRPRKATAQLVPHQTTAIPTCVTFTGDKVAAFCYQRYMLGDVKTMRCVGQTATDSSFVFVLWVQLWALASLSLFLSWLPFIGPVIRALFLHIQKVPGSNLVHGIKWKAFKIVFILSFKNSKRQRKFFIY